MSLRGGGCSMCPMSVTNYLHKTNGRSFGDAPFRRGPRFDSPGGATTRWCPARVAPDAPPPPDLE